MEAGGAGGQLFNKAGDDRQIRLATDQGGSHMIHSGNITPIGFVVDGRTGVNCKKLDNLSYEQIYLHVIFILSPCIKSRGIISAFSSLLEFLEPASFGSFLVLRQEIGELLAFRFDCCPFSGVDHPQSLPRSKTP